MIKMHPKMGKEKTYLNIVKITYDKPTAHILSDDKLRSSVICGMLQMQAGGRGPGKNL